MISLDNYANQLLAEHIKADNTDELQTVIHPNLHFRRNSVNLLIGRRSSGKSFNVFREMIKLNPIKHDYSQLIYVTNKLSDDTFHKMKKLINLDKVKVKYEDAEECITKIIEAKEDYNEIVEKGLQNMLDPIYRDELLNTLNVNDFTRKSIHTAVLFDDAIEVFRNRKSKLFRMLFENRQPKITYFLCIQDPIGLDPSVKSNVDTVWIFGGFSPQKFNYVFQQINSPYDRETVYEKYKDLSMNQALIFDYGRGGTTVKILEQ